MSVPKQTRRGATWATTLRSGSATLRLEAAGVERTAADETRLLFGTHTQPVKHPKPKPRQG